MLTIVLPIVVSRCTMLVIDGYEIIK
jgi:hypothetical protein